MLRQRFSLWLLTVSIRLSTGRSSMILYLLTLVFILEITVKNSLGGFLSWQESELFCEIGVVKCTQQVVLNSLEKQVTRELQICSGY